MDLTDLLQRGQSKVVKQAPHRVVSRVTLDDVDVHVKHYGEGVARWLRGSRARYEYEITREVARRGVPTLEALAWSERCRHLYQDFGIDYEDYALGRLEDRCFTISLR